MIFTETPLPGAFVIDVERHSDERGFFARSFCAREFAERGLDARIAQCSVSFNRRRGTLRGLHYQAEPHPEARLVQCTRGAVYDVIVDLRPGSAAEGRWFAAELDAAGHRMLYVPEGFAHGFMSLVDDTEVLYQMSEFFRAESARAIAWDDPGLAIEWPMAPTVISARDRAAPRWRPGHGDGR